ncbi:MAG TPA: hypothetical protein VM324_16625 [Egibacteraceae bacterium]|nr:hypothetical protein [Egibacteraceae bacterium]
MSPRSEYDAAYFTMLRAVEERDTLLRYREFLEQERRRLDAFAAATRDAGAELPRRVRRPVDQTEKALLEAVGRRRTVLLEELSRAGDRVEAAEAFVAECEAEVASLRR